MTAHFAAEMTASNHCASKAVVCASARMIPLLDTAAPLAVSVCIAADGSVLPLA